MWRSCVATARVHARPLSEEGSDETNQSNFRSTAAWPPSESPQVRISVCARRIGVAHAVHRLDLLVAPNIYTFSTARLNKNTPVGQVSMHSMKLMVPAMLFIQVAGIGHAFAWAGHGCM